VKKKQKPHATKEQKLQCFEMLSEGYSMPQIEEQTGINRGTLSRWRRSQDFALYHAERTTGATAREMKTTVPQYQDETTVNTSQRYEAGASDNLADVETRGKFLQAVGVGGLAWAQDFSGASDEDVAKFIRDLDVRRAHAKPRIMALTHMLKLATDADVPHAVRAKAIVDWWRLADNNLNGGQPMINIDARGSDADTAPKVAEFIVDSVRQELAKAADLDLMADVPTDD
tara:strand:- start:2066 stop:2752 length:687 start_codon:yes stop_codon:yes gene_type:complete